MIVLRS